MDIDDEDVKEFLGKYHSKETKEFTLWCYSQGPSHCKGSKQSRSPAKSASKPGSSRYEAHVATMAKTIQENS